VKQPRHDDERLSALLAGRLQGPERDELLAHLSTAEESYEVFTDTAAILRELEDEESGARADSPPRVELVPPSLGKTARRWPHRPLRWIALAAVVAGLVALGVRALRGPGTPGGVSPVRLAMSLEHAGPGLPFDAANPSRDIPGDLARGGGAAEPTPEAAARAGAFLVRLALAVQARDSAATATLALQMQPRFDPQGAGALRRIQARAGAAPRELQPLLAQASGRLEARLGAGFVRLGAWAEAARLAARQRDAGYFRSADNASMLRLAERLTGDDAGARAAVAAVRRELDAERRDWSALERSLTALLEAITG